MSSLGAQHRWISASLGFSKTSRGVTRRWHWPGFGGRSRWRLQQSAACEAKVCSQARNGVEEARVLWRCQLNFPVFCFPLDPNSVRPPRRRDEGDHPWREPGPGFLRDRPRGAGCWGAVHTPARAVRRRRTVSGLADLTHPHRGCPGPVSLHKASSLPSSKCTGGQ